MTGAVQAEEARVAVARHRLVAVRRRHRARQPLRAAVHLVVVPR